MDQKLDLKDLVPNFSSVNFTPETGGELSALFIIILIAIFVGFLLVAVFEFIKSIRLINWIQGLLKNETSSTITLNRFRSIIL